ncbi:hypothetical protein Pfo_016796 [Paulownia fortunei]|nr:hypothetical protein Pfo_016796 [Paulownia fortunei]
MPKLLGEFLQEQQEPFALEVYLLERGCPRGISLNARCTLCSSAKFLKCSASCSLKKRRYVVPNCSNFLKAVFSQFVMANDNQKFKNSGNGGRKTALVENWKNRQENAAEDRFSAASSTPVFNSCSDRDVEDARCPEADIRRFTKCGNLFLERKVDADRKLKWRAVEDSKQLSPVSVLEETESDEGSPVHYTQGECSTSMSQFKLKQKTHYSFQELQELVGLNSYAQYIINKRALQQTKQLLIDCVREVMEKHRKRDKRREQLKKILGAEEVWKLVCENVWLWSQDSIDESNIVHLLHYDFLASAVEWSADSEQQKMEISTEVGNAILEDVINEIVTW